MSWYGVLSMANLRLYKWAIDWRCELTVEISMERREVGGGKDALTVFIHGSIKTLPETTCPTLIPMCLVYGTLAILISLSFTCVDPIAMDAPLEESRTAWGGKGGSEAVSQSQDSRYTYHHMSRCRNVFQNFYHHRLCRGCPVVCLLLIKGKLQSSFRISYLLLSMMCRAGSWGEWRGGAGWSDWLEIRNDQKRSRIITWMIANNYRRTLSQEWRTILLTGAKLTRNGGKKIKRWAKLTFSWCSWRSSGSAGGRVDCNSWSRFR